MVIDAALGKAEASVPTQRQPFTIMTMLRYLLLIGVVSSAPFAPAFGQSCRASDATARGLVTELRKLVTSSDPRVISARDSIYHVPVVPDSTIVIVTADSICAAAGQALNTLYGEAKARTVYVVALGTGWAVLDPADDPTGRYRTVVVFNSAWASIGGYSGP